MFNLGGGEILVILLLALIVLGPAKLPDAARKMGNTLNELKKISKGFQDEFQSAFDEPLEAEARAKGEREAKAAAAAAAAQQAAKEATVNARVQAAEAERSTRLGSGTDDPQVSTAAAAGMYDASSAATPAPADAPSGDDVGASAAGDDAPGAGDDASARPAAAEATPVAAVTPTEPTPPGSDGAPPAADPFVEAAPTGDSDEDGALQGADNDTTAG